MYELYLLEILKWGSILDKQLIFDLRAIFDPLRLFETFVNI